MGAGGVGTLRINFVWGAVESGPGAQFDWSHYDTLIGEAAAQGIRVLPTVYSSPLWAAARDNYPPSPGSLGDYAAFVEAAAARYGSNGTFWAENPDIPRLPVRWWQFWNEPNLQVFWLPKLSARSYVDLLRVFSPAIRRGDPNARVLLAGLFPGPFTPGVVGIPLARYLPAIYRQRKAKTLFDGVDIHPYAIRRTSSYATSRCAARSCPDSRTRRRHSGSPKMGWTTGGDPSRADGLTQAPSRISEADLPTPCRQPEARQDRRRDLVLVEGPAGFRLVQPHGPVHDGLPAEAIVVRLRQPDGRIAGRVPAGDPPRGTISSGSPPAIAGRITTVSESEAPVSRPSSTRTSSSLR